MMEVDEEPYEEWLIRELSEMGVGMAGATETNTISDIIEHQRMCLERKPETGANFLKYWGART